MKAASEKNENAKIRIIPLGGLEQIGMNMTIFEYEDNIIVVDCGLSFPDDDMLGIDLVIPDITYLKENIDKVKGFVITHGHEDHIGAIPYILREVNAPIYATKINMTEYLLTVKTYLENNNNMTVTAKKLFIHRNTLISRINKIEELTGKKLSDADVKLEFLCAFKLLEFLTEDEV